MKPRVYLDQNILGYLIDEALILNIDDYDFVYSETHFKEFPKSDLQSYCKILDKLNARCMKLHENHNDGFLLNFVPVATLYDEFMAIYNPEIENSFDGLMSYLNGSQDKEKIESFVNLVNKAIDDTSSLIRPIISIYEDQLSQLGKIFKDVLPEIESSEENRKKMGTDKGRLNVFKKNTIQGIFDLFQKQFKIDFEILIKRQFENKSLFLKVVSLHSFLNLVGYNPDKKLSDIDFIQNIRHDGEHIAYGIFCDCIISEDRRFIKKAAAIYEYLNIRNVTLLVHIEGKSQVQ